jgi:mannose-6-phosphate isomerase-like protein (cupin superfamily)
MGFDATTRPFVARGSDDSGVPFGSSGRGRLRVYTQWADETGVALVNGVDQSGEPRIRDHVHSRHDETFVVIQGTYRVRLDDKIVTVEAGEIVFVPRGTAHTFRHVGPDSGRMLNVISPADGADMIFAEAVRTLDEYRAFTVAVDVPVLANLTEFGMTPAFTVRELKQVGVRLVLYPLSAFRAMSKAALDVYRAIIEDGTQAAMLPAMQTREELYAVLGYHDYERKLDALFAGRATADAAGDAQPPPRSTTAQDKGGITRRKGKQR